ncbi:MAG: Brp/Blh family beta-carotene 15,15'-dioxygenase [Haloferacaceae archaeon]
MSGEVVGREVGDEVRPARPDARLNAERIALGGGMAAVALGIGVGLLGGSIPLAYQYLPLVASAILLGVPHGAVDHLVLPRSRGDPVTPRSLAFVGALYLVVGAAYAAVWFRAPAAAFVLFLLFTLLHWGQGDVYALLELSGATHLRSPALRAATAVVRGGLPMLVPLVAFPDQYRFVAGTLVGLFDPGGAAALDPAFRPAVRAGVAVGFGAVIAATLAAGYRRATAFRPWAVDAGETLLLVAYFGLVPPVLAIGLYFPLWHSLRHVLRTMLVDDRAASALTEGAIRRAFRRFARDAAPLTAAAFLVLGAIALTVPYAPATVPDVLGLYLVFIAVLTLPHVIVVSLLDREQGIWTSNGELLPPRV